MLDSEKSTSIVSSFSSLLLKAWNEWDVRGMILLSLLLQIILSVLGNRRKYTINLFTRIVLWFAYLSADWVAIASLGKLSSPCPGSTTNILRAFWAPLLILHLGGSDTITAYAYEDSKLWTRHLLILLVKVVLAVYVIFLSWSPSWLSFLTLPLIIAGIAKYAERILCLKLNNSQKTEPIFSFLTEIEPTFKPFVIKNMDVLGAFLVFSLKRSDVNNYQSYSLSTAKLRINTFRYEIFELERRRAQESMVDLENRALTSIVDNLPAETKDIFPVFIIELGLIFDFVYTKSALIYTKTGCFLRLTSFACSSSVLLLFLMSIMNDSKFHFSRVDIYMTTILLGGAIALELFAAWLMFSSDWAILVATLHHNAWVRKMFWVILKCFPCFLNRRKRWSDQMGQFDLLKYSLQFKRKEASKSCICLQKITYCNDLIDVRRKYSCTKFVEVPSYLKQVEIYPSELDLLEDNTFKASRGKKALQARDQYDQLKWSIQLDFDCCIIVWHLATSVCYYHDNSQHSEDAEISKRVSDYLMFLLVMRPTMLLPEDSKSFWLDHTYDKLKELFFDATDTKAACKSLLKLDGDDHEENPESSFSNLDNLLKSVRKLTTSLNNLEDKWKMIKEVWVEMLFYAAFSSGSISHVKQLGEGGEFLSLVWLLSGVLVTNKALE
ncbi:hypothetical protein SLEP1_g37882 [Rubroshorea leprosula]|uniref:DUF4220 domain-containing protein n=1 Tax=Rubroshorea leprosula TaxID=152421 RepID=A0AAV5KW35_9ROSI|nr:hypothetical protein SLEP1_g37882 [Rubroshorea leprosula]